jgi:alpha-1,2-mannosyltransferase
MLVEVPTRHHLRYHWYCHRYSGYASVLLLTKVFLPSTTTAAYVHYPFISEDMIQKVREQRVDFNNSQLISRSPLLSKAKLVYYLVVLKVYKMIGRTVDFAFTNSSWTHNHMSALWPQLNKKDKLHKVYPPCTVDSLLEIKKPDISKDIHLMSLAQFRPEKQQHLQLEVLSEVLKCNLKRKVVLRICGTTRGSDDEAILQRLKELAANLKMYSERYSAKATSSLW